MSEQPNITTLQSIVPLPDHIVDGVKKGIRTFEIRRFSEEAEGYPSPFSEHGYGGRVDEYHHGGAIETFINRQIRLDEESDGPDTDFSGAYLIYEAGLHHANFKWEYVRDERPLNPEGFRRQGIDELSLETKGLIASASNFLGCWKNKQWERIHSKASSLEEALRRMPR